MHMHIHRETDLMCVRVRMCVIVCMCVCGVLCVHACAHVYVRARVCVCVMRTCQVVVNCDLGPGNHTQVLCKSSVAKILLRVTHNISLILKFQ